MSANGDIFVVLNPSSVIIGRNSEDKDSLSTAQEIHFETDAITGEPDGGVKPDITGDSFRLIRQTPKVGAFGADFAANDRNVVATVSWSCDETPNSGGIMSTDIVRYILCQSSTAADGVDCCGKLVEAHGLDGSKFNLVICDSSSVWTVSCAGKLWAAQEIKENKKYIASVGLAVTTNIDRSSSDLADSLKSLGLWNGEGELNFAACFDSCKEVSTEWCGPTPADDGSYKLTDMFETLRSAANSESSRSANVSVLSSNGISCHWFTGTPNANESVFKPFVFAPNPKISPLTRAPKDGGDNSAATITLLYKLHAQRKPGAVEDLKALEAGCVEEVNAYLAGHTEVDSELDEIMKDCVEAEVKFYR